MGWETLTISCRFGQFSEIFKTRWIFWNHMEKYGKNVMKRGFCAYDEDSFGNSEV